MVTPATTTLGLTRVVLARSKADPTTDKRESNLSKGKTGVLIHGLHLQLEGWKDVVWGTPPDSVGRLPKGVAVAVEQRADVIVLGTGASEIDGKVEAEYTRDFLLEHFSELTQFSLFQGIKVQSVQPQIERILQTETRSQNTYQEIKFAAEIFKTAGVTNVFLVSSPTHLPRCLRDACTVFREDQRLSSFAQNLYASPSQTSFHGTAARDVAIVEPLPRQDTASRNLNNLVHRMLKPGDCEQAFLTDLEGLLARHEL